MPDLTLEDLPDIPADEYAAWRQNTFARQSDAAIGAIQFQAASEQSIQESLSRIGSWAPTPSNEPPASAMSMTPVVAATPAPAATTARPPSETLFGAPEATVAPEVTAQTQAYQWTPPPPSGVRQVQAFTDPTGNEPPAASMSTQAVTPGVQGFVSSLLPYARQVEAETGIPASLLLAIPANETGWGRFMSGNNLYGIKGSNHGKSFSSPTWEVVNGQRVNITDTFRGYDSPLQSMRDFAMFLWENPRYHGALQQWQETGDATQLLRGIHAAGYATDPQWSDKVLNLMGTVDRAATAAAPPSERLSGKPATGTLKDVSQFDQTLTPGEAAAACGPAAAARLASLYGNDIPLSEVVKAAREVGWSEQAGMAGVANQKRLLDRLGIPARLETDVNWSLIQQDARADNPVTLSTGGVRPDGGAARLSSGHYFTITGYDPETGKYRVGSSGTDLRGGGEWMSRGEIEQMAGQANGVLFVDNPASPQRSVAAPAPGSPADQFRAATSGVIDTIGSTLGGVKDAAVNTVSSVMEDPLGSLGRAKDAAWETIQGPLAGPLVGGLRSMAGREQQGREQQALMDEQARLQPLIDAGDPEAIRRSEEIDRILNQAFSEDPFRAATRNPDLGTLEMIGGIGQGVVAGALAPSLSAGLARNVAAGAIDPGGQVLSTGLETTARGLGIANDLARGIQAPDATRAGIWASPADVLISAEPGTYRGYRGATEENLVRPTYTGGAYIASRAEDASPYAHASLGGAVHKVEVDAGRVFDVTRPGNAEALAQAAGETTPQFVTSLRTQGPLHISPEMRRWLEDQGYDTLLLPNESGRAGSGPVLVSLHPEQRLRSTGVLRPELEVSSDVRFGRPISPEEIEEYPEAVLSALSRREFMGEPVDDGLRAAAVRRAEEKATITARSPATPDVGRSLIADRATDLLGGGRRAGIVGDTMSGMPGSGRRSGEWRPLNPDRDVMPEGVQRGFRVYGDTPETRLQWAMFDENGNLVRHSQGDLGQPTPDVLRSWQEQARALAQAGGLPTTVPSEPWRLTRADYLRSIQEAGAQPMADIQPRLHSRVGSLDEFLETVKALHTERQPIYLRTTTDLTGDLKRGYSTNHATGQREAGLSVDDWSSFDVWGTTRGAVAESLGGHFAYAALGSKRPPKTYLLQGEPVGVRGSDNEVLLRPGSIRVVAEIDTSTLSAATRPYADAASARRYPNDPLLTHQRAVESALAEGRPVPPEVLAEYPKLAAKPAPATPDVGRRLIADAAAPTARSLGVGALEGGVAGAAQEYQQTGQVTPGGVLGGVAGGLLRRGVGGNRALGARLARAVEGSGEIRTESGRVLAQQELDDLATGWAARWQELDDLARTAEARAEEAFNPGLKQRYLNEAQRHRDAQQAIETLSNQVDETGIVPDRVLATADPTDVPMDLPTPATRTAAVEAPFEAPTAPSVPAAPERLDPKLEVAAKLRDLERRLPLIQSAQRKQETRAQIARLQADLKRLSTGPQPATMRGDQANRVLLNQYGGMKTAPASATPSLRESLWRNYVRAWTDRGVDLNKVQEAAEQAVGRPLQPHEQAAVLRRLNPSGAADLRIQEQLRPAVQSVGPDADYLRVYLTHQDNLDVAAAMGNELRQFSGGLTVADSRAGLEAMRQTLGPERMAKIEQAAEQVWQFGQDLLARKRDAGLISQELFDDLVEKYPHYSPTRILDYLKEPVAIPAGKKLTVRDAGLKRNTIEGTTRQREDPLASFVRLAYETEGLAAKNEAAQAFLRLTDHLPDDALLMRKVADDVAAPRGFTKMSVFEDGQRGTYLLPDHLAKAIAEEPVAPIPILTPFMNLFRALATQRNPVFLASNALMDAATYTVRSSARMGGPQHLPRILTELVKAYGDTFQGLIRQEYRGNTARYLREGGAMSGFFSRRPEDAKRVADALERTNAIQIRSGRAVEDVQRLVKDALLLKPVEAIGERIELAPRVAAMRLAERQGKNTAEAVIAGRTVTVDFAQGGVWAKVLNQVIPFFNVAVQSGAQVPRAIRENPRGFLATATGLLAAPTVAVEAWNRSDEQRARDYEDVPDYVKDAGLVFMLPVPAPTDERGDRRPPYLFFPLREYAPFAVLTREAAARALGAEPSAWQDTLLGAAKSVSPVQGNNPGDVVSTGVPLGVSTALQLATDTDYFRGRKIATKWGDEDASALATVTAEALQKIGITARPSQVEFAARDLGAGVGGSVLAASDLVAGKGPKDSRIQSTPGVGGLIGRFLQDRGGGEMERARRELLPGDLSQQLKEAGVTLSLGNVGDTINDIPLTRAEQTLYQQKTNQHVADAVRRALNSEGWDGLTAKGKDNRIRRYLDTARERARLDVIRTIPEADRTRRRREARASAAR